MYRNETYLASNKMNSTISWHAIKKVAGVQRRRKIQSIIKGAQESIKTSPNKTDEHISKQGY